MAGDKTLLLKIKGEASSALNALRSVEVSAASVATAVAAAGAAFVALFSAATKMADLGDQARDVERGFNDLAASAGLVGSAFLGDLQTNTDGAISKFDLMKTTTKGLNLGLEQNGISLRQLARDVKTFADASGEDFVQKYDGFIQALATGRTISLQTQGIILDTAAAYDSYGEAIGKNAKDLTEHEKLVAKQIAAAEKLHEIVGNLSQSQRNAGDAAQSLFAAFKDLFTDINIGVSESDELRDALDGIAEIIRSTDWRAFGKEFGDGLSTVVSWLKDINDYIHEVQVGALALSVVFDSNVKTADIQKTIFAELKKQQELEKQIAEDKKDRLAAEQELVDYIKEGERATRKQVEAQEEATKEAAKTREELQSTIRSFEQGQLKKAIEDSIKGLSNENFAELLEKFRKITEEGLLAGMKDALALGGETEQQARELAKAIAQNEADELVDKMADANTKAAEDLEKKTKDAVKGSVDFFQDIFYDAITGSAFDFELTFKKVLAGIAAGAAGNLFPGLGGIGGARGFGQSIGASLVTGAGIGGLFGSAGAAGAPSTPVLFSGAGGGLLTGGLLTAGAGAGVGLFGLKGLQDIQDGKRSIFSGGTLGGLLLGGIGATIGGAFGLGGGLFGGSNPEQDARDAALANLPGSIRLFGGGTTSFNSKDYNVGAGTSASLVGLVNPLAGALSGGDDKLKSDLAGIFSNALSSAKGFNAELLATRGLMNQLGLDGNAVKVALLEAFDPATDSLEELQAQFSTVNQLMADSLPVIGDVEGAFKLLGQSVNDPQSEVEALRILFTELEEAGIDTAEGIGQEFENRLGGDGVAAAQALAAAGISSAEDVKEALSNPDIFLAILSSLGGVKEELLAIADNAEAGANGATEQLSRIAGQADDTRERLRKMNAELAKTDLGSASSWQEAVSQSNGRRISQPLNQKAA